MAVHEREIRTDGRPGPRIASTWEQEPPLGDLFRQLAEDATTLIRQEVALGKAELRESAKAVGRDAAKVGMAIGIAALGALAATAFLIIGLGALIDSYWLSALIVAVVYFAVAGILAKQAKSDLENRELKPVRTMETVQADARWAKQEVAEVKREWKS
jgi:uncharacterized membrane protein YqjE